MGTDCRKYVLLDLDVIALTVVVERVCKEILSVHQCTVDLFQYYFGIFHQSTFLFSTMILALRLSRTTARFQCPLGK